MIQLPSNLDVSYEVGDARFSTYLKACQNDFTKASRLYMWNMSLSSRWWSPLSYLEVALRNTIHDQLTDVFGRTDWWKTPDLALSDRLRANFTDAESYAMASKSGTPTADAVVGASSFGLWVSILHTENAPVLWRDKLDRRLEGKRGVLYDSSYKLKKLRDRIAHHEPIFAENQHAHVGRLNLVSESIHMELPDLMSAWFPGLDKTISGYNDALERGLVDL